MERSQATVHFDQLKLESIVRTVVSDIDGALHASVATVTDGQTSVLVTTDPAFDIEEDDGPATSTLQTGRAAVSRAC